VEELIVRFLLGGAIVSLFSLAGDLFRPKSFAGLFGGAPSVALATLALTISKEGARYASAECRAMVFGAVSLSIYSLLVCWLLMKGRLGAFRATIFALPLWAISAAVLSRLFG
jgi:hypothetical protein